jgi:hypothetical protein
MAFYSAFMASLKQLPRTPANIEDRASAFANHSKTKLKIS